MAKGMTFGIKYLIIKLIRDVLARGVLLLKLFHIEIIARRLSFRRG